MSSRSVTVLQFFSLLDTISSNFAQHLSFVLPQAIAVFMLKHTRTLSSLVRYELVVWVFLWLVFRILSFTASRIGEMSSRTTLQSFTWAAMDPIDLYDAEIDLLRHRDRRKRKSVNSKAYLIPFDLIWTVRCCVECADKCAVSNSQSAVWCWPFVYISKF